MGAWLRCIGIICIVAGGIVWLSFAPRGLSWGPLVNVPITGGKPVTATFTPTEDLPYHIGVSFEWLPSGTGSQPFTTESAYDAATSIFEGHKPGTSVKPAIHCMVSDEKGPVVLGPYRGIWSGSEVQGIAGTFWGRAGHQYKITAIDSATSHHA